MVPFSLSLLIKWIHLLAAFIWIGGMLFISCVLGPYVRTIESVPEQMKHLSNLGRRFRDVGWIAIGLLLITGILNLAPQGLSLTLYGQGKFGKLLMVKHGAVIVMIVLSILHDFVIGPRATATGQRSLRRQVVWLARLNLILGLFVVYYGLALSGG